MTKSYVLNDTTEVAGSASPTTRAGKKNMRHREWHMTAQADCLTLATEMAAVRWVCAPDTQPVEHYLQRFPSRLDCQGFSVPSAYCSVVLPTPAATGSAQDINDGAEVLCWKPWVTSAGHTGRTSCRSICELVA